MRVEKRTFCIEILSLVFLSLLLVGCSALSGSARSKHVKQQENGDYFYDTIPRIKELEYLDFFEQASKEQWDSIRAADFGQPFLITYPNTLADSIIEYAKLFLKVPYKRAGKGPDKFDCSGFTSYVFRHFGYELRATTNGQLDDGWKVITKPNELRCGDLVFYGGRKKKREVGHVGIVVSNDTICHSFTFIHATVKLGVTISNSTETYYVPRYITACRILPE